MSPRLKAKGGSRSRICRLARWPLTGVRGEEPNGRRRRTRAALEFAQKLDELQKDDQQRNELAKTLFNEYALEGNLMQSSMRPFGNALAMRLGLDLSAPTKRGLAPIKHKFKTLLQLERMQLMFKRFDGNCDGLLDENEVASLLKFMVDVVRKALGVPQLGVERVQLGRLQRTRTTELTDRFGRAEQWQKIGKGGQGSTYLAKDLKSGLEVVLKRCRSYAGDETELDNIAEFELLMALKHPRIEHIYDIFRTMEYVYIVKEPYYGGDLRTAAFRAAEASVRVGERWLAGIFQQVLEGVHYLHNSYIVHCDLKEANVMIASTDLSAPQIKIIDFGLASRFDDSVTWRGTGHYKPPEAEDYGIWTPGGDIFSMGIMLFVMATGEYPTRLPNAAASEDVEPSLECQSSAFAALVVSMIDKDLDSRPNIPMLSSHKWFKARHGEDCLFAGDVLKKLGARCNESTLRRALLANLAQRMHLGQLGSLNDLFVQLDENDDGTITENELRRKLQGEMGVDDIEKIVSHFIGTNGKIDYHEFIGLLLAEKMDDETELLRQVFNDADQNGNGLLDEDEVRKLLTDSTVEGVLSRSASLQIEDVMQLMREAAEWHQPSGQVDFTAFAHAVQMSGTGVPQHTGAGTILHPSRPARLPQLSVGDFVTLTGKRMRLINAFRFTKSRYRYMRLMNHMLGQEYRVERVGEDVAAVKPSWLSTISREEIIWLPMRALTKKSGTIRDAHGIAGVTRVKKTTRKRKL